MEYSDELRKCVIGSDTQGSTIKCNDLKDGHYYEMNNLIKLLGLSYFTLKNDIYAVEPESDINNLVNDIEEKGEIFDKDFEVMHDEYNVIRSYMKEEGKDPKEFDRNSLLDKLVLKYNKEHNSLVEPISKVEIRLANSDFINGQDPYVSKDDIFKNEIKASTEVSPLVAVIIKDLQDEKDTLENIKEVGEESINNASNKKWAGYLKFAKKKALEYYKKSLEKVMTVEHIMAEKEDKDKEEKGFTI